MSSVLLNEEAPPAASSQQGPPISVSRKSNIFMKNHEAAYKTYERLKILPYVERVKSFLTRSHIKCFKFNYSLDEAVQNFNNYEAYISLSEDHSQLIITNRKPVDKIVAVDYLKGANNLIFNELTKRKDDEDGCPEGHEE